MNYDALECNMNMVFMHNLIALESEFRNLPGSDTIDGYHSEDVAEYCASRLHETILDYAEALKSFVGKDYSPGK